MSSDYLSLRHSIVIFLAFLILSTNSYAQPGIKNINSLQSGNQTSGYGRDLWFAIPLNFSPTDRSTKYFTVYVISQQNTTVNFQITGGPVIQKQAGPGQGAIFTSPSAAKPSSDIPLNTEMYSSGVIESKAIHVWSDNADIAVYLLSRRDYSSGGMYVIPTIGWGTEYIVGAYESIFDPTGGADWPSEFAIVSNQDNTTVTITPNWDLRKDGFPAVIDHPKNQPFSINLNKGECVQYQTVLPINDGECDVTGTIISSNNPIGVMGASVDPYIYFPFGYGDNCLSMLQPVSNWSNSYLTAPFGGRKYGGDAYCIIASQEQIINRNGIPFDTLRFKGDHLFIYDDNAPSPAAIWTSNARFELMQYIPSANFGTGNPQAANRNQGDADMCPINPTDQFVNNVYFEVPVIDLTSSQTDFTNFVNVIVPISHEGTTTYDSVLLNDTKLPPNIIKKEKFPIQNTIWEAIRLTYSTNAGEGMHIVNSDTGIGVYLYGYGTDDSYSWSGNLGISPITLAVKSQEFSSELSENSSEYSSISSFLESGSSIAILPPSPNPAISNASKIRFVYGLNSDSPLDLAIYDMIGNHIATLIHDDRHSAGIFEENFILNGDIMPGCYIYRLAANGKVLSGKFIIAR